MTWVDQLQMASFRDVPFHVDSVEMTPGDNVVLREYPFQDLPTVFRMGTAAEEIKFSAYVIGDDYMEQRERLREVLTGEGLLVHPTAGAMMAYVAGKYSIKEAPTAEGGMARFDLVFVRAETRRYPYAQVNTQAQAADAAATAKEAAKDGFAARMARFAQAPAWVQERVVDRLRASVSGVWGQLQGVTGGLGDFTSGLIGSYQVLRDGLGDLVATPRTLADQVGLMFSLPTELTRAMGRDFQTAFSWAFSTGSRVDQSDFETIVMPEPGAGLVMFGAGDASTLGTDAAARAELAELLAASDQLFGTLALSAYVETTALMDLVGEPPNVLEPAAVDAPISYDDVMTMRAAVADQGRQLLVAASSAAPPIVLPATDWHAAVAALQGAALADLQARSRDLVRLTSYTPTAWVPVHYVSFKLFGTAAYADELLALNPHIEHPLLVPPGIPLRVMRHG